MDLLAVGTGGADRGVASDSVGAARLGADPGADPVSEARASVALASGGSALAVQGLVRALAPGLVVGLALASDQADLAALVLVALGGVVVLAVGHGAVLARGCLVVATSSMPCSTCSRSGRSTATR